MHARRAVGVAVAVFAVAGACTDPARAHIVDTTPGACGKAMGETSLKVTALTPSGDLARAVAPGDAVELDGFPADTEQLSVAVLGATDVEGKSAPLDFTALADGADIPIFAAPENGLCATGSLLEPRSAPLVALAGDGVLVVGGTGPSGPLSTAERYDYATATFVTVPVPTMLVDPDNGLAGAVLTSLPDGRVALTGTSRGAIAFYNPAKHAFDGEPVVFDQRAFHGAIATDAGHLLVSGGCSAVGSGACAGLALRSSLLFTLSDLSSTTAPILPEGARRIGAILYDTGAGYVLAGGSGDPGVADRLVLGATSTTTISGLRAQLAPLDGGSLLSADGSGTAALAPGGVAPVTIASGTEPGSDATLVALEDGRVLALGSDRWLFDPTSESWSTVAAPTGDDAPGALASPTLLRLPDGSVLVLGASPPTTDAWVFRPSLVGPSSGSVVVVPSGGGTGVITAPDPSTLAVTGYVLTGGGSDVDARALIGGTRMATGSLVATVSVQSGGVAVIARQLAPGDALVARLVPGAPAELDDLATGKALGSGTTTEAFDPATPVHLELDVDGSSATLLRDGTAVLTCPVPAGARGAWGLAAVGGSTSLLTATVTR
nr:kelch repeat-containing protein [Kofleriaceae bacterium]